MPSKNIEDGLYSIKAFATQGTTTVQAAPTAGPFYIETGGSNDHSGVGIVFE